MAESPHYRELLHTFNDFGVEYLLVGGYAVMKYTEPRFTKDLDLWVSHTPQNALRLFHALAKFGAPLKQDGVTPETFTKDEVVYQIGVAPVRIDISTHIDGLTFDIAWPKRVPGSIFGVAVNFISLSDLITNKRAAGRTSDLAHLADLEREAKKNG
jgi:hypothetical protein